MKSVLFIGDSILWGCNPKNGIRHLEEDRWIEIFKKENENLLVFESGIPGMAANRDVWDEGEIYNSKGFISKEIYSKWPLDGIVICLGMNNILEKETFLSRIINDFDCALNEVNKTVEMISKKYEELEQQIKKPKIIFITPPRTKKKINVNQDEFNKVLTNHLQSKNIHVISALDINSSSIDNIHLEKEQNRKYSDIVSKKIKVYL